METCISPSIKPFPIEILERQKCSLSTQCSISTGSLQGERFAHNTMFAPTRRKVRSVQCSLQGERFAHNTMFTPTRRKVRTVHSVRSKAEGSLTTQFSLPQGGRFAQYTVFALRRKVRSVHSVHSKAKGRH